MFVYALVGPSGTGKSHHATLLAFKKNIPLIIDDGLLIQHNRILAGRSAKREATSLGAARRAIMTDPEHAHAIKAKITEVNPDKILVLGTSEKMTKIIAEKLDLPAPSHYFYIEEIVPPEEIKKAMELRHKENRHVVPLPTFAIKKDFPGYLISPMRSIFSRTKAGSASLERSIVRPVYSSLGNFFISEHVVHSMVRYCLVDWPGIHHVKRVKLTTASSGRILTIDLTVTLIPNLKDVLQKAQRKVKQKIEYLTGFYFYQININANKLVLPWD